jgi:hypothetical protein
MSEYDDDDQNTDGPADLRKALKEAKQRAAEAEKRSADLAQKFRDRELKDELTTRGLDARVAALIPADADVSEWLATNGDLFGGAKPATSTEPPADDGSAGPMSAEEIEELRRQQDADRQFRVPGNEADELAKVNSFDSLNDLTAYIRAAQKAT